MDKGIIYRRVGVVFFVCVLIFCITSCSSQKEAKVEMERDQIIINKLQHAERYYNMHPAFEIDKSFGFYGWYGFFACVGLVLAAKVIRVLLMREESYYDAE